MKYYLSSYGLGDETQRLKSLVPSGKIGYIPNALDFKNVDLERRKGHVKKDMDSLVDLGLEVEILDLRDYFGKKDELQKKLEELGAVFISGGNTFILRQAMKLSGMDVILDDFKNDNENFLYAGYSAAGCVLSPDFHAYKIVDRPETPYTEQKEVIWEGLGHIDYAFMPHYQSDHPESSDVEKEVELCKKHNIPYKTLRDGEVVIIGEP